MTKVAIGMPLVESMYSRFFVAWNDLVGVHECPKRFELANVIAGAYEKIARWFLEETDADVLLTLEQDHRYPANLLDRVRNYDQDLGVVGALYYGRYHPHPPTPGVPRPEHWNRPEVWEGQWDGVVATPLWPSLEHEWRDLGQLQRVLFVGMGCTMIRRQVLEDWPKDRPYFMDDFWPELNVHRSCDVYFCWQAARIGYPTYLDCGLVIPHMSVMEVTHQTYRNGLREKAKALGLPTV